MSYTPINWQTGDTITAEKMNKMDRGWGYGEVELFNEMVTTVEQNGGFFATLAYSDPIDADTITVTFDGTEYTCQRIDFFDGYYYGGFGEQEPVFAEYPFVIQSLNGANDIFTETASTHTVAASAMTMQTSTDFAEVVSTTINGTFYPLVLGTTTWAQVVDAMTAGKLVFRSWGDTYDSDTPNIQYAGFELVTGAYIDAHGDYYVSTITTDKSTQSVATHSAIAVDGVLN